VSPSGIASVEAFGSPVVTVDASDQTIVVVGVGSGEAFGTPVVVAGQNVLPGGIPTAEAFGVPTVTMPQDLTGGAAAFGMSSFGSAPFGGVIGTGPFPSATLYPGSTIYPGTAQSIPTGQTITPSSIPPTEAFGVPIVTLALGDQAMRITAIDSAEAFGIPTVTVSDPALVVQPGGILSAEAFGRAFVFVEVPPPVSTPGLDTYYVDGVDLRSFAWRITTADGLQNTPGVLGDDIVLPGLDGAVEVFGAFGQQRRPDSIGQITFRHVATGCRSDDGPHSRWLKDRTGIFRAVGHARPDVPPPPGHDRPHQARRDCSSCNRAPTAGTVHYSVTGAVVAMVWPI
jgi:hypothetical protein